MELTDVRASFEVKEPQEMLEPGKIAIYHNYLFVVDHGEGIHLIDNSNPRSPMPLKFIKLAACHDLSIKDDKVYANNGPDLAVIDISNLNDIRRVSTLQNVMNDEFNTADGYIVKYEEQEVIEVIENVNCNDGFGGIGIQEDAVATTNSSNGGSGGSGSGGVGTVGSMSRFIIVNDYLYIVDDEDLISIEIKDAPQRRSTSSLGRNGIETIFATEKELYIGSTTGMFIYDHKSSPAQPQFLGSIQHMRSCDPVVVKDNIAYLTLRSGNRCGGFQNVLQLIDVSDPTRPTMITEYGMAGPYGLGIDDSMNLFICDGIAGVKIFDAKDNFNIASNQLSTINGFTAYDVILRNRLAIIGSKEAVFQYDYTDPMNPEFLSQLFAK